MRIRSEIGRIPEEGCAEERAPQLGALVTPVATPVAVSVVTSARRGIGVRVRRLLEGAPMSQATINPFPRNVPVKVIRRRVLQHDLDMFAAICGRPAGAVDGTAQTPVTQAAPSVLTRSRGWSPSVLSAYLGHLTMPRLAVRVVKPEVADWVRKLSTQAMERLQEAQERLASARQPNRNSGEKGEDATETRSA